MNNPADIIGAQYIETIAVLHARLANMALALANVTSERDAIAKKLSDKDNDTKVTTGSQA